MNLIKRNLFILIMYITFFMLIISIILFTNYASTSGNIEKITQGFYSNDIKTFYLNVRSNSNMNTEFLIKNLNNTILFKNVSEDDNLRWVLFKGNVEIPNILKGRFFTEKDFVSKKKYAVIGKLYKNKIININNIDYIQFQGNNYEVIGEMGINEVSDLDKLCFINMNKEMELQDFNSIFTIDGKNKKDIDQTYTNFQNNIRSTKCNISEISKPESGVKRVLRYEKNNIILFIVLILFYTLTSILLSYIWFNNIKLEVAVKKLIGITNKSILFDSLNKLILIYSSSFIFTYLFMLILNLFKLVKFEFFSLNILLTYLITLIICTLSFMIPFKYFINKNVNYMFREDKQ